MEDLQWLSRCSRKLISLVEPGEILDFAGRALEKKLDDCIVVTFFQDPDRSVLRLEEVYGLDESRLNKLISLLGINLRGGVFAIENRLQDEYEVQKLSRYPGDLAAFAGGVLPRRVARKAADLLGIKAVYTIGFAGKERVLGNLNIFTRAKDAVDNPGLVEAFANQTALALERAFLLGEHRASEALHSQIFRGNPDALVIGSSSGKVYRVNEAAGELFGFAPEDMIGMPASEFTHPEDFDQLGEIMGSISRAGQYHGETRFVRRDGTSFRAEVKGRGFTLGEQDYRLASIRNISDQLKTRDELDFQRSLWSSLLENTPDLVYFKDREHRLTLCSQAYADIFDSQPEHLIGKTALDLWPVEGREILEDERQVLQGRKILQKERMVTNPIGEKRWYSLTKIPIYQGDEVTGFFAIDKDITEQKTADLQQLDHLREQALINDVVVKTSRMTDVDRICQLLVEKVYEVNPDAYVVASLYDPDLNAIRLRAMKGISDRTDRVTRALGAHPTELLIDIDNHPLEGNQRQLFTSGNLELIPDGLYALTRGTVPKLVCRSVERVMGVDRIYVAGFGLEGESRGGLTLFLKKGAELQFPEAIETLTSHVAVLLERLQTQYIHRQKTSQLEAFRDVEQMIISELDLDQLLEVIVSRAVDLVQAAGGGFSLYEPGQDHLEYGYHIGDSGIPENNTLKRGEGLAGQVWRQEEPLIVNDYASWEDRVKVWVEIFGNFNVLGVPVFWKDQFLGVLEVTKKPDDSFASGDAEILENFAAQIAIAIKNTRLFDQEKRRRQEAETLREVGMMMTKMVDSGRLLSIILEQLDVVLPYDSASVQLVRGSDLVVEAVAGRLDPETVVGRRFPLEEDFLMKPILLEGKNSVVDDVTRIDGWLEEGDTSFIRSWIGVPLEIKGESIGVLTVDHHIPGWYQEEDARLARNFANQAAIVIENARLLEETERQTRQLTALYQSSLNITRELDRELVVKEMGKQVEALFQPDSFLFARYRQPSGEIEITYALSGGERKTSWEGTTIVPGSEGGLLGWIIEHQQPLLIHDVRQETLPVPPARAEREIRSWLGAPLVVGKRVVGAMVVQSGRDQAFQSPQKQLLELLAGQAAIAFENSRLFDDAQRRMARITSLREVDRAISGTVDLRTTLEVLVSQLSNTLEVDAAAVLLYDPDVQSLDYVFQRGYPSSAGLPENLLLDESLAGQAVLERRIIHIRSLSEFGVERADFLIRQGFEMYLGLPLIAKGEPVGVLEVCQHSPMEFSEEGLDFLKALADQAAIAIDRLKLFNDLNRTNLELVQAYDATIEGWARAIELRDVDTEGHSRRVEKLTVKLAVKMGINGQDLAHLRRGALLHDIGKMAIPDSILLKEGELTEEEWVLMKKHPDFAYEMLSRIEFLRPALAIPYAHHEWWDGSGYPRGLAGEEIPLEARIFAVVDVWDALQSDRPYRKAWREPKTLKYIKDQSGSQFDPRVVQAFLELIEVQD